MDVIFTPNDIFIILIDGEPHTRDRHIRTYKTENSAYRQIRHMQEWDRKYPRIRSYTIGLLTALKVITFREEPDNESD